MAEHGGKDRKPVWPRTVEFARAVLRRAMNDAVVDRLIGVNPVIGSKSPKKDGKPQHVTWTGEQAQTFRSGDCGDPLSAPVAVGSRNWNASRRADGAHLGLCGFVRGSGVNRAVHRAARRSVGDHDPEEP
jgi:hypothetical protein